MMKHNKSVITLFMAALLCLTTIRPVRGAEISNEALTSIATVEETDVQEKSAEDPPSELSGDNTVTVIDAVEEEDEVESDEEISGLGAELEGSTATSESNENSTQKIATETEEEQQEGNQEEPSDINVAQAVWTEENKTLTFFYGLELSAGDTFNGMTVTNIWSGTEVTNTGEREPDWNSSIKSALEKVLFDESFKAVKPESTYHWFYECSKLTSIDFTGLDTSSVTNMNRMFFGCSALEELDVGTFDTSKVTDMNYMFFKCSSLRNLDLNSFDTSSVMDMSGMFDGCSGLDNLDVSRFDTSSATNMGCMFYGCSALESLDLSTFDTSSVTIMYAMFYECLNLTSLNISSFNTSNVTDMSCMFYRCEKLEQLDIKCFDTSNVIDMQKMFNNCIALTSLDVSGFDTSNVTDMWLMFDGCSNLESLDVSGFDTSQVYRMEYIFAGCTKLEYIDVSNFDTSHVPSMDYMFCACYSLISLDLSSFNTSNVTSMMRMFCNCYSLSSLDLSSFDTSKVRNMNEMFSGCKKLLYLDVRSFDTTSATTMDSMFEECTSLTSLDVSSFNTASVKTMEDMFDRCKALTRLDVSNFDTSNVKSMRSMFCSCDNLTVLDISGFDTTNVTKTAYMFSRDEKLQTIYCADSSSAFNDSKDVWGDQMFENCLALIGKSGGTEIPYDSSKIGISMARAASLGGYFTPKDTAISAALLNDTIIERVREYTSDDLYSQYDQIVSSDEPYELKFRRMNALFANYGFTDAKEGIHYLSNTNDKRYAYLMLTTDETYCTNNYVDWLNSGTLAGARRALLVADGLIFNNEINDWLSFTTYTESEYPGVKKYKTMLYDFMDATAKSIEIQSGIKFASDLASKSTGVAKIEAENIVNRLNACGTVAEEKEILALAESEGIYTELAETKDENGNILLNYKLDESSGFGEFQKLMGYGTKTLSITKMTISDIMDLIELDSKLATYAQYRRFLQEVVSDTSIPFELRWAANLIIVELDEGYLGKIKDVAMDIIGQTEINSTVKKAILSKLGAQSLSSWLTVINLGAFFTNHIANVGDMVKNEAYVEGYNYLAKSYKKRLEEAKTAFKKNPNEANAWEFYYNYNILYRLRYKGEKAYLKFSKIKGIAAIFSDFGYSDKKAVVDNTIKLLEERCRFTFDGAKGIPESCQFATKAVVKCPVDVDIVASDGTVMASLTDGEESDETNSYGRFAVVYDHYSGDYYKVICLNQDDDFTLRAKGSNRGLVNIELAKADDEKQEVYAINNVPIEPEEVISTTVSQVTEENTITRYTEAEPEGVEEEVIVTAGTYVPAESISLDPEELSLTTGESALLSVSFNPAGASNQGVLWTSTDPEVAAVTDGRVEAVSEGTATVYCIAQDNCELIKTCTVSVADLVHPIDGCTVEGIVNETFTGSPITQQLTLKDGDTVLTQDTDYTVSYDNNINAGTAKVTITGIGNYTGTIEKTFEITPKAITPTIKLSKTAFTYNRKVQKPTVTVMDGETKLAATDYALKWSSGCTNAGTYKVLVTLKGNYSGSASAAFKIKKAVNKISAKNVAKTYSAKAQTFALGVKISNGTPKYASNSKSVTVSKAGKVTVKAKFIGKATITITAPEYKNYSKSTKKITVTVVPTKTGIASVTSPAAGQMVVKWKKNAVGTGYQIQYSTSSKFTGVKSAWITKNTVISKKITNLTKGKKYYVRMRTYKTVGGVKYYSGWCTVKTVTIRK